MTDTNGVWEPYVHIQVLPRCFNCFSPHPLAEGNTSNVCLKCGEPVPVLGSPQEIKGIK